MVRLIVKLCQCTQRSSYILHPVLTDISQVARRVTARLTDFASLTSVCAPSGVRGCGNARSWADQAANPLHPGLAATFFSAADRPVLPLSFSLVQERGHAHAGGARSRRIATRMARAIGLVGHILEEMKNPMAYEIKQRAEEEATAHLRQP